MDEPLVLVDSSVWILWYRRGTPAAVATRVRELLDADRITTTGPVVVEVLSGARDMDEYERLREDFDMFHWCELSPVTWFLSARDAYDLRRKGITVPFIDIVIARAALDAGYTVLHCDKHYSMIAKVTGLSTEAV